MTLYKEKTIHFPDLSFIRFCSGKYGINRGIYNTIDTWFYSQGIESIIERRKKILCFLEFIKRQAGQDNSRKFGNGGLKIKLQEYLLEQEEKRYQN